MKDSLVARAKKIRLLLMDVDGVLTDGKLYYVGTRAGVVEETKAFDSKDGIGLRLWRAAGHQIGIISGRESSGVEERARILGFEYVIQGTLEKRAAYDGILARGKFKDEEVAYVGDDVPDVPVLKRVGLPIATADAVPEVVEAARFVTRNHGGAGAIREVCELILKTQGRWDKAREAKGWV